MLSLKVLSQTKPKGIKRNLSAIILHTFQWERKFRRMLNECINQNPPVRLRSKGFSSKWIAVSSRIWTQVADYIYYIDKCNTKYVVTSKICIYPAPSPNLLVTQSQSLNILKVVLIDSLPNHGKKKLSLPYNLSITGSRKENWQNSLGYMRERSLVQELINTNKFKM